VKARHFLWKDTCFFAESTQNNTHSVTISIFLNILISYTLIKKAKVHQGDKNTEGMVKYLLEG
jgi:hypothetical protein